MTNDKIPMCEHIAGLKAYADVLDLHPLGKLHEALSWACWSIWKVPGCLSVSK